MTLGQKLKKLRTDKNLTQKDLADQLHVTFQTISKWENDENEPDIATLKELAKLYDCSVDYLISEDEQEQPKEEIKEEVVIVPVPEPAPAQTQTIIIHQKEMHVCEVCNKDIPEDDLAMEQICTRPGGRGHSAEYRQGYYHKACLDELNKQRAEKAAKERAEKTSKAKKMSFGWGIAGGAIAMGIALLVTLIGGKGSLHPALAVLYSSIFAYVIFADVYCILSGSFIGDVFLSVAGWSIRFPGIIFTWDIGGFIFLIVMKILFAILGFLFGVLVLFLAVGLSALLASICFPFILIHNTRTGYADAI